jgi:hypothetical protein
MGDQARLRRLQREEAQLQAEPPLGVCCWRTADRVDTFVARACARGPVAVWLCVA